MGAAPLSLQGTKARSGRNAYLVMPTMLWLPAREGTPSPRLWRGAFPTKEPQTSHTPYPSNESGRPRPWIPARLDAGGHDSSLAIRDHGSPPLCYNTGTWLIRHHSSSLLFTRKSAGTPAAPCLAMPHITKLHQQTLFRGYSREHLCPTHLLVKHLTFAEKKSK